MPYRALWIVAVNVLACALATPAAADDGPIEEIVVRSTRIAQSDLRVPFSVSVVGKQDIQLGRQQLGIDEALSRVPGLFFQDRYNFNQDLRISIRGFGAQAQFGIAGVHLTVDDIPVTTPDGTSQVDDLDMGSMGRIEVVRGPSAALYGTSAGGAINMYTEEPSDEPSVEMRAMVGDYDTAKYQIKTSGRHDRLGYLASVSYLNAAGFRDFSQTKSTVFNSKLTYQLDDTASLTAVAAGVHSPLARDPGALTPAELASGPRNQARSLNVTCNVRERVDQYRGGIVYNKSFNASHALRLRGYGLARDFDGNLPCPFVGDSVFDRRFFGGGAEYSFTGAVGRLPLRLVAGAELTGQRDDRQGYETSPLGVRGAVNEDQLEQVDTRSLYALAELSVGRGVLLTAAGRFEDIDFELHDHFLADGDNSDTVTFSEFTPMAGITWMIGDWLNLYGSVSTSFETPTFSQMGDPAGPGINGTLDAQTSTGYEIGAKGAAGATRYSLALFTIDLEDQLVPYEVADDVFYRNAGESTRRGLELSLERQLLDNLTGTVAYTLNDFEFDHYVADGVVLDGNDNPGIPRDQLYVELSYARPDGWFVSADLLHVGRLYADDGNSRAGRVDPYDVVNARFGRQLAFGRVDVNVFAGINNLFNAHYFANVRINQTFDRFFEPAPGRNFYGGVSVRL